MKLYVCNIYRLLKDQMFLVYDDREAFYELLMLSVLRFDV